MAGAALAKTRAMTTTAIPEAPISAPTPPGQPLQEAATYVGLVTVLILGFAFALPHANVVQLLTMVSPLLAVGLITFVRTPRGRRRELWGIARPPAARPAQLARRGR